MMVDNLIEDGSNKKSISGMMPRRTRSIMPSLTRFRRRKDPPPMPKQLKPLPLEEGNQMLVIETPRSPSIKSGGSGRQLSPNFLMSTRKNAAADKEAMGFGDDNSFSNAREPLPPIRPPGLPSPTRRSAGSRGKQALSPYASSTAPPQQVFGVSAGLLPQLGGGLPGSGGGARNARSPLSPNGRYRVSPRGGSPSRLGAELLMHSSPPTLENGGLIPGGVNGPLDIRGAGAGGPVGATFFTKRLGSRSRGLDVNASAQRLTFEIYGRIASPAKLHAHEPGKRKRAVNKAALPAAFAVNAAARSNRQSKESAPAPSAEPPSAAPSTSAAHAAAPPPAAAPPRALQAAALAETDAVAALNCLPPLAEVLAAALPKGPVGSLQQQADASMMLLRCDWKASDIALAVQLKCHRALHFMEVLASRAKHIGTLKGTLFQALMARHVAEQQRLREEEEARLVELEMQAQNAAAGGEEELSPHAVDALIGEELGVAITSSSTTADAVEPIMPVVARDEDIGRNKASLPPVLHEFSVPEMDALGEAGAELRGLLRIKIEDDQDMKTAQQALAECGYFLLLLREEAPKRKISESELLKKCDMGEA